MGIKSLILKTLNMIPLRNCILLESFPDLSDNTKAVYDEMIRRKWNYKLQIIWFVDGKANSFPKRKNVKYISQDRRLTCSYYSIFSKTIVCCNRFISQRHRGQKSIYLTHGLPIKSLKNYYYMPKNIQYLLSSSKKVEDIMSREFHVPRNKIVSLGYPRNDVLINPQIDFNRLFRFSGKVIVWLPTFRQQRSGQKHGGNALPIIHNDKTAVELNRVAKNNNILIVLKPHFAQDMSYIKKHNLSNIKIISDAFLQKRNISLYQMLSSSSALLTDYSSVYYDYTLCDKPIGVVWEDIEEYRNDPGFAVDLDHYLKGAEKIYKYDELANFIIEIANGEDKLKKERNEIKEEVTFTDGMSAKRVVDFIERLL